MPAFLPASGVVRDEHVHVDIGHVARETPLLAQPGLVLVGIAPPGHPWMSDLLPGSVVRESRPRDPHYAVEHLRLRAMDRLHVLPGMGGRTPSLLRDAVTLALGTGLPTVDVVLLRTPTGRPWIWDPEDTWPLLEPIVSELPGAVLVFPDLGGPSARGFEGAQEQRTEDALPMARRVADELGARWQTMLLDLPDPAHAAQALLGRDVGLCAWQGGPTVRSEHGWRSAAALVGARLVGDDAGGLAGRAARLVGGRQSVVSRAEDLSVWHPPDTGDRDDRFVLVDVRASQATILQEPSLRAPLGEWPLSAVRTVKQIHWSIYSAADAFVFRLVHDAQAYALAAAIDMSTREWVASGILAGPDGRGPVISADIIRDRDAPGLVAEFTGRLRPWGTVVNVRVNVRPGVAPHLEER